MPKTVRDVPDVLERWPGATAKQLRHDRIAFLSRLATEGLPIARLTVATAHLVLVNDPDMLHELLTEKVKSFSKSPVLRAVLHPLGGDGLFTSDGELWRKQRKVMAPLFQPAALARYAGDMVACSARELSGLREGAVLDVAESTTRITMSIAGKTLFDTDTLDETDALGRALTHALQWSNEATLRAPVLLQARLAGAFEVASRRLPAPWGPRAAALSDALIPPLQLPGKRTKQLREALATLEALVARMIAERRSSEQAERAARRDLLAKLLGARDESGAAMTDKQVRDEVLTLFVAGHETTAAALAWALYLLAKHPEARARAEGEARALAGPPTADDLPRLAFCARVFKETLRLYPPAYLFGRMAAETVTLGDYELPGGTICLISPYTTHRRRDLWPDPERFAPDRFAPEAERARHKYAYLPFGGGPRTCIGNHFALMEGPLVLATLLRRARFDLAAPGDVLPEPGVTLRPRDLRMRVTELRADPSPS